MEPVQGLNLNRRYISGLEPEMPVTMKYHYLHQEKKKLVYAVFKNIA